MVEQRRGAKTLAVGIRTAGPTPGWGKSLEDRLLRGGGWGRGAAGMRGPSGRRACSCLPKGASQRSLWAVCLTVTRMPRKHSLHRVL